MIPMTDQIRDVATDETVNDGEFRLLFLHLIGESQKEVPAHLKLVLKMLNRDQTELVKSRERKLENDRERKRRYKTAHAEERGGTRSDAEERGGTPQPIIPIIPIIPTNHPTPESGVAEGGVVSLGMVMETASKAGIPEDFARDFYDDMSNGKWVYNNRYGNTVLVTVDNFAATLIGRWKSKRDTYTPPPPGPTPKVYTTSDWELCRERCANFNGKGCAVGVKVPPDKSERQIPPDECCHFKPMTDYAEVTA